MGGGLFGLGKPTPSRFPYAGRPQPSPGISPTTGTVVRARQVIIFGPDGGLFIYSGIPTAGNLIETGGITAAGTDRFGNMYLPGSTTYNNLTGYAVQSYQGAINFYSGSLSIGWTLQGSILGQPSVAANHSVTISNTNALVLSTFFAYIFPSGDTTGALDRTNINSALSSGYGVKLLSATYYIDQPISGFVTTGGVLHGMDGGILENGTGTIIKLVAGFSGGPAIKFPLSSQSHSVRDITFDGSAMPANTAECIGGISASHSVLSVKLENLYISGLGFTAGVGNPNGGTTWRGKRIMVHGVSGIGFNMSNAPDSEWIDCLVLTAGQYGWRIQGSGNAKFIGCRAENCGLHGFYITGISSLTGGVQLVGCSTDGNTNDGVRIDQTGACPTSFTDLQLREDGKAGAGNYAFHATAAATIPWSVNGLKVIPGTNGGSTGQVPGSGIVVDGAQTLGLVSDAMVMVTTTPLTGVTAVNNISWRNLWTNIGNTGAPGAWTAVADSA